MCAWLKKWSSKTCYHTRAEQNSFYERTWGKAGILEFLRHWGGGTKQREQSRQDLINEIAPSFFKASQWRILDGILNEIASLFVSLTPRNDEFYGILKFTKFEFQKRIPWNLEFLKTRIP